MKFIAILAIVLMLLMPVIASEDMVYAMGMGMYAKEIQYETALLKAQYESGKINETYYHERLGYMNRYAEYFNTYLKGNFNDTMYEKWKLPINSV